MAEPMSDERLRDQIAEKLAEWAFQAAEAKSVKLTSFHRHVIEQEAPVRADMVMTVVQPELERLRAQYRDLMTRAKEIERQRDQFYEQRGIARSLQKRAEAERDEALARIGAARIYQESLEKDRRNLTAERDEAREQVRVLAMGADPLCPDHGDHVTTGCESCAHASAVRTARSSLDGTGAGQ